MAIFVMTGQIELAYCGGSNQNGRTLERAPCTRIQTPTLSQNPVAQHGFEMTRPVELPKMISEPTCRV